MNLRFPCKPDWTWLIRHYPGGVLLHADCSLITVAQSVRGRLAYLATPYSREVLDDDLVWNPGLSLDVETRTARWARAFAIEGVTVASPILTACAILHADPEGDIDPLDDAYWSGWCQPMLMACGSVVVPPMAGWERSRGVWREACWALRHNVPVYLVSGGA